MAQHSLRCYVLVCTCPCRADRGAVAQPSVIRSDEPTAIGPQTRALPRTATRPDRSGIRTASTSSARSCTARSRTTSGMWLARRSAGGAATRPTSGQVRPHPDQCTMGPQPDLARHQGSRRLVANGVKCMSNYSELSTYHEYGNIFPMSCTVFALQEPEVRTLKQSLVTSLRLAKSVD